MQHPLLVLRMSVIFVQSLFLLYSCCKIMHRYFKTYDTLLQFEIWFMLLLACIVCILLPNYLIFNNLNWLMFALVVNSFSMQIAGFHIHNKVHAASIYGGKQDSSLALTILLTVRMFILFCIVVWTLYKQGGLICLENGKFQYPVQIIVVMQMDFANAVIDMFMCACFPTKIKKP